MILSSYLSIHNIPHLIVAADPIPDTIMVNGEKRPTRNNRGGLIYPTLSGIRNFWAWFDDSKVVDEHGRPILCFHGTRKDFEFFDGYEIPGWVSEDEELAHSYSRSTVYDDSDSDSEDEDGTPKREPSSNIMPLYVKVTNPFRVSENMDDVHEEVNTHAFMVKCEHSGHDGMFGYEGDSRTWAIFNPNQAKSATGNNGTFSHSASVTASTKVIAYHGSDHRISSFRLPAGNTQLAYGNGIYFSPSRDVASKYGRYLHVCELSLDNPYIVNSYYDDLSSRFREDPDKELSKLIAAGYDSVKVTLPNTSNEIVVYDTSKIKVVDVVDSNSIATAYTDAPELTAEDLAWFSGSKVVDRNGNPLVVYHGSYSPLVGEFKPTPNEEVVGKSVGFYLTPDEFTAESYGPHVSAHIIKASRMLVLPQNLKYAQARRLVDLLGIDRAQLESVIKTVGPKRGYIRAFHLLKDGDSDWGGDELKLGSMVLEALKARGVECVRFIEGRNDAEYVESMTYCVFDPKNIRTIGKDLNVTTVHASSGLTFSTPRVPLDFDKLYGKAFKVTDAEGDSSRDGFSIITPFANKGVWSVWKEKPQFKSIVKKNLNNKDFLGDHKYEQVIDAATKLGLM